MLVRYHRFDQKLYAVRAVESMAEKDTCQVGRLESMSLEFGTRHCGMQCPYCYVGGGRPQPRSARRKRKPLTVAELLDVVDQAVELGLGGVGFIGPYEPLQEPEFTEIVVRLRARGLRVTVFTKGQCITEELAEILSNNDVTLGITVHALHGAIHDQLTGVDGSYRRMMQGIRTLLQRGYDTKRQRILIQSVVLQPNIAELLSVWRWARERGFTPFIERLTVQGAARAHMPELSVTPEELCELFHRICAMDRAEFGRAWSPHPPWIGESCTRHLNGCHLTVDGYVQPCTGVDIPLGNVRDVGLADILRESFVLRELRDIQQTIQGACRNCVFSASCYGCRGQAYQLTGDYLAADPCCWHNPARCDEACSMAQACRGAKDEARCAEVRPSGVDLSRPERTGCTEAHHRRQEQPS